MRLDQFLSQKYPQYSRARIQKWIDEGRVTLEGKTLQKSLQVTGEEDFQIDFETESSTLVPEDLPLRIIYEDEELLIINKHRGMVVHPGAGHLQGTLVHALLFHVPSLTTRGGEERPGIVHRVDKDTSGLLLIAKTDEAWDYFHQKFKERDVLREYLALVEGEVSFTDRVIDKPLARSKGNPLKRVIDPSGKEAITEVHLEKLYEGFSLLRCRLRTGRTHQIRVHLQSIGHPIIGDPLYARRRFRRKQGQLLHASKIGFKHPVTKEWMAFTAPLPEDFERELKGLKEKTWK